MTGEAGGPGHWGEAGVIRVAAQEKGGADGAGRGRMRGSGDREGHSNYAYEYISEWHGRGVGGGGLVGGRRWRICGERGVGGW